MTQTDVGQDDETPDDTLLQDQYDGSEILTSFVRPQGSTSSAHSESPGSSVAKLFGYFEDSESNALALVRKVSTQILFRAR